MLCDKISELRKDDSKIAKENEIKELAEKNLIEKELEIINLEETKELESIPSVISLDKKFLETPSKNILKNKLTIQPSFKSKGQSKLIFKTTSSNKSKKKSKRSSGTDLEIPKTKKRVSAYEPRNTASKFSTMLEKNK